MKILHVESGMHLYGGALQVDYLLTGLQAEDCCNILVCPCGSRIAEQARNKVDRVYEVAMRGDLDVLFIFRLLRIIRAEQPDVVHLHSRRGADLLGGIAARLARTSCGCRILLTRRVDNPEPRWWVGLKYRLYDHVITISEGIRRVLLDEGLPEDKVSCVHSAVDQQRFGGRCERSWMLNEFGLPEDARCIAMVAQFIERKGHRYLLQAVPAIVDKYPDVRFLLFGQGPLLAQIRTWIETSPALSSNVILCGFRPDLERILPCIDILVHPAEMEGLGVSLLQAAACGVAIVATRAGGMPEIVDDDYNGYLIAPGAVDELVDRVKRLLEQPERLAAMGEHGRQRVAERFSLAAMVSGNLAVYKRLLA